MSDPFVGEIRAFPFNFAPIGWALCNGQLLAIAQNTALFSLLGTYYGGDGRSSFALPDLQASVAIGAGQGPGLSPRNVGDSGGAESVTLTHHEVPPHTHGLVVSTEPALSRSPHSGDMLSASVDGPLYSTSGGGAPHDPTMLGEAGGSHPHSNLMPSLVMHYCIALQGIYPARP